MVIISGVPIFRIFRVLYADTVDPVQMPHSAASDFRLQCLCMTPKWVSSLRKVNPIALRKAKTVRNFGLSECNRYTVMLHCCFTSTVNI